MDKKILWFLIGLLLLIAIVKLVWFTPDVRPAVGTNPLPKRGTQGISSQIR